MNGSRMTLLRLNTNYQKYRFAYARTDSSKDRVQKKISAYGLIIYYFSCHKFINKKYDFSIKKASFPSYVQKIMGA